MVEGWPRFQPAWRGLQGGRRGSPAAVGKCTGQLLARRLQYHLTSLLARSVPQFPHV